MLVLDLLGLRIKALIPIIVRPLETYFHGQTLGGHLVYPDAWRYLEGAFHGTSGHAVRSGYGTLPAKGPTLRHKAIPGILIAKDKDQGIFLSAQAQTSLIFLGPHIHFFLSGVIHRQTASVRCAHDAQLITGIHKDRISGSIFYRRARLRLRRVQLVQGYGHLMVYFRLTFGQGSFLG